MPQSSSEISGSGRGRKATQVYQSIQGLAPAFDLGAFKKNLATRRYAFAVAVFASLAMLALFKLVHHGLMEQLILISAFGLSAGFAAKHRKNGRLIESEIIRRERRSVEDINRITQAAGLGRWEWTIGSSDIALDAVAREMTGLTGTSAEQPAIVPLAQLHARLHPEDVPSQRQSEESASKRRRAPDRTLRFMFPGNEIRYIRVWGLESDVNEDGVVVRTMGLVSDITASVIAEQDLKLAQAAQRQFIANVSHEFRTPLNAIMVSADLLSSTSLTDEQTDYVETLCSQSNLMFSMVNDVLDLGKLDSDQFVLSDERFSLESLLSGVRRSVQASAAKKGLELSFDRLPADVRAPMRGDPARIRQILINLLNNAIGFTDHGRVQVKTSLVSPVTNGLNHLRFEIVDTGCGIAAEDHYRIFQRFVQLDGTNTRSVQGSGLGLAIVRELAERMGGRVTVDSQIGRGSTFTVELRLASYDQVVETSAGEGADRLPDLSGMTVLIVDDSRMNLKVASRVLERSNATTVPAEDGQQALDWLFNDGNKADLVLMDLQMPVLDGTSATRAIRKDPRFDAMPIVAMTAAASMQEVNAALSAGMQHYLPKPFDPDTLVRLIAELASNVASAPAQEPDVSPAPEQPAAMPDPLCDPGSNVVYARFRRRETMKSRMLASMGRSAAALVRASLVADSSLQIRAIEVTLNSIATSAKIIGADHINRAASEAIDAIDRTATSALRSRVETLRQLIEHESKLPEGADGDPDARVASPHLMTLCSVIPHAERVESQPGCRKS